ncbi:hypothetical protein MMC20_006647 [Loxospora ochrophaea]|nr:hypothetical protein [Loxospora ochrophaea]
MSRPSLPVYPGKGLGFLLLGASLHEVLTRLKAQPHMYTSIHLTYSTSEPLSAPVLLTFLQNGIRLRFDGPDQRLRLIEVLDFTRASLSYKNVDLVKLPDTRNILESDSAATGPAFRHVYHKLFGPTFPGEYIEPLPGLHDAKGTYVLSYPGLAFSFSLQDSAWSSDVDFVSLLSSSAASSAQSMAIFNGASWQEARRDLYTRPCVNPRSLALSGRVRESVPDEIELIKVYGRGEVEMLRRSSPSFLLSLNETTPQDLIAELGPPDAIYRKNDRRLSIHKTNGCDVRQKRTSYGSPPPQFDDSTDTDRSSTTSTTEESDIEDDIVTKDDKSLDASAECFYNYFHHGFDVFISRPALPSPALGPSSESDDDPLLAYDTDHLVATKILLHANVPGSYPFNRYRRSRWMVETEQTREENILLDSETPFSAISESLRRIWRDTPLSEDVESSLDRGMVLNRGWGDSPGSSCELLGGWEGGTETSKQQLGRQITDNGSTFGNTELFGLPGLVFEVLKNGAVSCLTVF